MKESRIYDLESAPQDSKPLLQKSIKAFGSIPNLHGVMAESPQALAAYQDLHQYFLDTSFNAEEMTVVWQSINVEHNCHYCVPAHSAIAKAMKVADEVNEALRNKTPLPTEKLEVLRDTTLAIVRERGVISDEISERFYAVGYNRQNLLEIIVGVAQKVMSNYINHLADTPVDPQFAAFVR
ncbi:carboxymuconolactone decarboxylase family protein [Microbulbifer sp. DLAB2-AF]|uniref:Carboxymuconolactone decarboxylase family protein n=1 Tax=Microbulbifer variabilis TaxID=266805 RepID=A0ABY4VG96_9GAMM|nr:carboxymuconolactone decarboxylase family protein [Microbulbifer variabilis]USD21482.1 carboxymuconolactone decarboxylase family protein [Microbulbifer variabilis]